MLLFPDTFVQETIQKIGSIVQEAGGRAIAVGGCVRDSFLGFVSQDFDIEVYRLSPEKLQKILRKYFSIDLVGESFGVLKLRGVPVDISIPRRENKSGSGHRGFTVYSDPSLTFDEAAYRRDFTINAMGFDLATSEFLDPYGGKDDLKNGILRHTSEKFSEDPLRVLRGMQLTGRFNLKAASETMTVCRKIQPENLPKERISQEWKKLILQAQKPSLGLQFLSGCGWIQYFPELEAIFNDSSKEARKSPNNLWNRTLFRMDQFVLDRIGDEREDLVVGFACLCLNLPKRKVESIQDGPFSGKVLVAANRAIFDLLDRLIPEKKLIKEILPLVLYHHFPSFFYQEKANDGAIRRLAVHVGYIDRLIRVAKADYLGANIDSDKRYFAGDWLCQQAQRLLLERGKPPPIVQGRHLIQLGLKPGKHFSKLLEASYQAQIKGNIQSVEEGLEYLKKIIQKSLK